MTSRVQALAVDGFEEFADSMLLLDEREAARIAVDRINVRRLAQLLWILAAVNSIYVLVSLGMGSTFGVAVAGAAAVADLWLIRDRHSARIEHAVRQVYAATLVAHLLLYQFFHLEAGQISWWFLVFPVLAARVRLSSIENLSLFGALYGIVVVRLVAESLLRKAGLPWMELTLYLFLVYLPLFGLALWVSTRVERRFLARWRSESVRHRDRLRMKQELEYAREIQLSMLPAEAPDLLPLDVAAVSLPANEVGGDYYDYFQLDEHRLAVVVGDVTGHGVASGLVLSGVRSCLNLLQEELHTPQAVLPRVNTMLKRTATPRMLMTLVIAVLDTAERSLTVATAGHPPVLLARDDGRELLELGHGSFPLGAMKVAEYQEQRVALADGDVMLLYSDGIVESVDGEGELYGWERLRSSLSIAAAQVSDAAGIRDRVLRDLWDFKGEAEQPDDVTMVVLRFAGP